MKKYKIEISQNGWEYTGYAFIDCENTLEKIGDNELLLDGKYSIKFDEEINEPILIDASKDEDYNFDGFVFK